MRIVICNVPLRSEETRTIYPPLGPLAIIQALRSEGHDAFFYDINFFRPSDEEIKDYLSKHKFDIVGISATVSTSYKFVKKLTRIIKTALPDAVVVIGGALTASSEIVLNFNDVNFCVVGEGERVIANLVRYISYHAANKSEEELKAIKGLCFRDPEGRTVFTGYEAQISVDEIQDADYGLIERYSRIEQYIVDPFLYEQFENDDRSFEAHRKNKRLATVISSRGCVNRCAFCYRWQRGIRILPVDRVMRHIEGLMERYDVGFISFGDEDFGASRKWLNEFVEKIGRLDILYRISGICCDNVDLPLLKRLKGSGCVSLHYGFESGSNRMLNVMEKRADAGLNTKAAIMTHEAGLQTATHLVVGMPGESYKTIGETTEFVKRTTELLPREPVVSVNALVVLPGTPVYEYARYRGLLGRGLEDEERYLLSISDQGGVSLRQLNLTDYPYFIVLSWIRCICWAARYNYYRKHHFPRMPTLKLFFTALQIIFKSRPIDRNFLEGLYGNSVFYHLRYVISVCDVMYKTYKDDRDLFIRRSFELMAWPFKKKAFTDYIPLRGFMRERLGNTKADIPETIQLVRSGR